MTLKMELWVEGPTDARTHERWKQADEGQEAAFPATGALAPLVRKALLASGSVTAERLAERLPEERVSAHLLSRKLRGVVHLGGRRQQAELSNRAWKVLAALDQARRAHPDTLLLAVWDRDGKEEPLRDRDRIHQWLRERGKRGAAVGICVEEIEAWLLGDAAAFARCFGRGPKGGLSGAPESEARAKEKLMGLLDGLGVSGEDPAVLYRKLAEHVAVDVLEKRCPKGFGVFREALAELIVPCLLAD